MFRIVSLALLMLGLLTEARAVDCDDHWSGVLGLQERAKDWKQTESILSELPTLLPNEKSQIQFLRFYRKHPDFQDRFAMTIQQNPELISRLSYAVRLDLAKTLVGNRFFAYVFPSFGITDQATRHQFFRSSMENPRNFTVNNLKSFQFTPEEESRAFFTALRIQPHTTLNQTGYGLIEATTLLEQIESYQGFAAKRPDLIRPEWIDPALKAFADVDIGRKLIWTYSELFQLGKLPQSLNPLDVLIARTELKALEAIGSPKFSYNRRRDAISILLDLQSHLEQPAFSIIKLDPSWFSSSVAFEQWLQWVTRLRDLLLLEMTLQPRRTADELWAKIIGQFSRSQLYYDPTHAQNILDQIGTQIEQQLNQILQADRLNMGTNTLAFKDIERFRSLWIEADSLTQALSQLSLRYANRKSALPLFKAALFAEIKGEFKKFKFEGDPSSLEDQLKTRSQLEPLLSNPAALQYWKETQAALTSVTQENNKHSGFILTVVTPDFYDLLNSGNVVKKRSCVNTRDGSHIETLPAYIADANVKIMKTYFISDEQIGKKAAAQIRTALEQGETPRIDWIGSQQKVSIGLSMGTTSITGLDYAQARQILKLGKNDQAQPKLMLEKYYENEHPYLGLIHAQHEKMKVVIESTLGGQPLEIGTVHFPTSRNLPGIYVDSKGGIEKGTYSVRP